MNYQCCSDNCVNEPAVYCLCKRIPIILCLKDLIEHTKICRDPKILDIKTSPLSKSQIGLLEIKKIKISLKNTKKLFMSKSSQLVELIDNSIQICQDHINKLENECDEVFRLTLQDENTLMINHNSIFTKLASDQIQNNLKDWNYKMIKNCSYLQDLIKQTLDISDLCENQIIQLIGSKQRNTINLSSLETQIQVENNLSEDHYSLNNEIIFFKGGNKELNTINLDSFETQIKEIKSLPEDIDSCISICELPNKSKFCYGNGNGLTFILDQNQNIILLQDGKVNSLLDIEYYNNFVYAIGGGVKLAKKYNLLKQKWESCASIPYNYNFSCSRSALIRDQLVIIGLLFGKVICYDISLNNYHELTGINLIENVRKFAFTGENRVYIGECHKNVYESDENDLTRWNLISTTNPVTDKYQISYYSLINESVYFLNWDYNLYEFKLRTKEMKFIKDFK